jgi:hypothetical protein
MPLPILDLSLAAPHLDAGVAIRAEAAYECAERTGEPSKRLLVVDMSLPASQKRLWAFDTTDPKHPVLIVRDKVAHGAGSDPKDTGEASRFGNAINSWMTSLGLYRIAEPYKNESGRTAFSLDGLDPGFNSEARERHVVLHPAPYVPVGPGVAGRSQGCPAVSAPTFRKLEKAGVEGGLLWIDGPDPALAHAASLSCAHHVPAPQAPTCQPAATFQWVSASTLEHSPWSS